MAPKEKYVYIVFLRYPPGLLALAGKAEYTYYGLFSSLKKAKMECEIHLSHVKKDAKMEWHGDLDQHSQMDGMDPMGYPIYSIKKDVVQ